MPSERTEDYLEALNTIILKKGYAKVKDVSDFLRVSPSSTTEMFQKLQNSGYINYEKYSGVTLTDKGKKIALKTAKKHETLRQFLQILGVPKDIANEDACRIEHVVNTETMSRLKKFVEFVDQVKGDPRWLEHFKQYYETGNYECDKKNKTD